MDILGGQYKSPFGYYNNDNQIDSYGVNHSGFSTADELRYQTARADREKQLKEQLQSLGITKYPQYKTDFWGTNADNNYGFGSSNIRQAVDNMQQTTYTPVPIQPQYWESAINGKQVYDNVVKTEGNLMPTEQGISDYITSAIKGMLFFKENFSPMKKLKVTDKYKHAIMNCIPAQYGQGGADIAKLASDLRELWDVSSGSNTLDSSQGDNYANQIGRLLGSKYPQGDCDALIQKYIKKDW